MHAHFAARRDQPAHERPWPRIRGVTAHREEDRIHLARRQAHIVNGGVGRQLLRPRIEGQRGPPRFSIESLVDQQGLVIAGQFRGCDAAAVAVRTAHLEQVREVVLEQNGKPQVDGPVAVVADAEPLIGRAAPQKNRAQDMHGVFFQAELLIGLNIGIGQIDEKRGIVVTEVGAE